MQKLFVIAVLYILKRMTWLRHGLNQSSYSPTQQYQSELENPEARNNKYSMNDNVELKETRYKNKEKLLSPENKDAEYSININFTKVNGDNFLKETDKNRDKRKINQSIFESVNENTSFNYIDELGKTEINNQKGNLTHGSQIENNKGYYFTILNEGLNVYYSVVQTHYNKFSLNFDRKCRNEPLPKRNTTVDVSCKNYIKTFNQTSTCFENPDNKQSNDYLKKYVEQYDLNSNQTHAVIAMNNQNYQHSVKDKNCNMSVNHCLDIYKYCPNFKNPIICNTNKFSHAINHDFASLKKKSYSTENINKILIQGESTPFGSLDGIYLHTKNTLQLTEFNKRDCSNPTIRKYNSRLYHRDPLTKTKQKENLVKAITSENIKKKSLVGIKCYNKANYNHIFSNSKPDSILAKNRINTYIKTDTNTCFNKPSLLHYNKDIYMENKIKCKSNWNNDNKDDQKNKVNRVNSAHIARNVKYARQPTFGCTLPTTRHQGSYGNDSDKVASLKKEISKNEICSTNDTGYWTRYEICENTLYISDSSSDESEHTSGDNQPFTSNFDNTKTAFDINSYKYLNAVVKNIDQFKDRTDALDGADAMDGNTLQVNEHEDQTNHSGAEFNKDPCMEIQCSEGSRYLIGVNLESYHTRENRSSQKICAFSFVYPYDRLTIKLLESKIEKLIIETDYHLNAFNRDLVFLNA